MAVYPTAQMMLWLYKKGSNQVPNCKQASKRYSAKKNTNIVRSHAKQEFIWGWLLLSVSLVVTDNLAQYTFKLDLQISS